MPETLQRGGAGHDHGSGHPRIARGAASEGVRVRSFFESQHRGGNLPLRSHQPREVPGHDEQNSGDVEREGNQRDRHQRLARAASRDRPGLAEDVPEFESH